MKVHKINLTSAEWGILWSSYMAESAAFPVINFFNNTTEDLEVKQVIELLLKNQQNTRYE
ncbi:DUF3231 family protein [Litchfieldia alkalitelluris]|uniref:DUF3231 family protein n=1 Tax=Litchfieldia alkalitelluris TaxID=304268 RepID=UPI00099622F5|nr:DUF3231 family protein [Litchfieldia alkalitelluris]